MKLKYLILFSLSGFVVAIDQLHQLAPVAELMAHSVGPPVLAEQPSRLVRRRLRALVGEA